MTIDIAQVLQAETTFDVHIKHPGTGEKLGPVISVYGMDSAAYRRTAHLQRTKRMKNIKPGKMNFSPDEIEADSLDLLVACTAGWKDLQYEGAMLPYTVANALRVYKEQAWLREQVDEAIADRANFSKES